MNHIVYIWHLYYIHSWGCFKAQCYFYIATWRTMAHWKNQFFLINTRIREKLTTSTNSRIPFFHLQSHLILTLKFITFCGSIIYVKLHSLHLLSYGSHQTNGTFNETTQFYFQLNSIIFSVSRWYFAPASQLNMNSRLTKYLSLDRSHEKMIKWQKALNKHLLL